MASPAIEKIKDVETSDVCDILHRVKLLKVINILYTESRKRVRERKYGNYIFLCRLVN